MAMIQGSESRYPIGPCGFTLFFLFPLANRFWRLSPQIILPAGPLSSRLSRELISFGLLLL
jgi:hypothetical protein